MIVIPEIRIHIVKYTIFTLNWKAINSEFLTVSLIGKLLSRRNAGESVNNESF